MFRLIVGSVGTNDSWVWLSQAMVGDGQKALIPC